MPVPPEFIRMTPFLLAAQAFFLENLVVPAAREYGLEAEYQYLRPSIKKFPTGEAQLRMYTCWQHVTE